MAELDSLIDKGSRIPSIEKRIRDDFRDLPLGNDSTYTEIISSLGIKDDMQRTKKLLDLAYFGIALQRDRDARISDLANIICYEGPSIVSAKEPPTQDKAALHALQCRFSAFVK